MSVVETILVFAVIPLAIVLLFAVLTLLPGRARKARYKPGQQWEYPPVWWEPHPLHGPAAGNHDGDPKAIGSSVYPEPGDMGHGRETASHGSPSHGASAAGASATGATAAGASVAGAPAHGSAAHGATAVGAAAPLSGAPLGGARGTW